MAEKREPPLAIESFLEFFTYLGLFFEWDYVPLDFIVPRPPTYVWVWRVYPRTGGVLTRIRFSGLGMIEEVRNIETEKPPQSMSMSFFDFSLAEVKKLRYHPRDGWDALRVVYDSLV